MYVAFVTGGISCGKSTMTRMLVAKGARAILLDEVGREVLDDPDVIDELVERFGPQVECCMGMGGRDDRRIDRAALARAAFADEEGTAALNAITHPRITARLGALLTEWGCSCMGGAPKVVVVEVPLIEAASEVCALADEIVAVTCPVEIRRQRAIGRGGTGADFDARNARQISDSERARLADTVISSEGGLDALQASVDAWWRERESAGWRGPRPR